MIERFLRWIGYEEACAPPSAPRRYQIPQGLCPRVLELWDKEKTMHHTAQWELWSLLGKRCPETKDGNWKIVSNGHGMYVEELLK